MAKLRDPEGGEGGRGRGGGYELSHYVKPGQRSEYKARSLGFDRLQYATIIKK